MASNKIVLACRGSKVLTTYDNVRAYGQEVEGQGNCASPGTARTPRDRNRKKG
jgi:hypothetical protein